MKKAKIWLDSVRHPDRSVAAGLRGDFEVSIVMMQHKKSAGKDKKTKSPETLNECCQIFVEKCEKNIDVSNAPWSKPAKKTPAPPPLEGSPKKKSKKDETVTLQYTESGGISFASLSSLGFQKGAKVKLVSSKDKSDVLYNINEISETDVTLTPEGGAETDAFKIPSTRLVDTYKVKEQEVHYTMMKDRVPSFVMPKEVEANIIKGAVLQALRTLSMDVQPSCHVKLLPKRSVIAADKYKKKELQLVAFTTSVGTHTVGNKPASCLFVEAPIIISDPSLRFHLAAARYQLPAEEHHKLKGGTLDAEATPMVVPYWLVAKSADRAVANMERAMIKFTIGGGNSEEMKLQIPTMVNTRGIADGEELIVYEEPPPEVAKAKAKAKGKGKH